MKRMFLTMALALGVLTACRPAPPPAEAPQRPAPPAPEVPAAPAPTAPTPTAPTPAQAEPAAPASLCEVEIAGELTESVAADQQLVVYVASGDCLLDGGQILARSPISGGKAFFVEVFVPCGTHLSLCGALEPREQTVGAPKPSTRYGKLPRDLLAVGEGEIEFKGLTWSLGEGPAHTFVVNPGANPSAPSK